VASLKENMPRGISSSNNANNSDDEFISSSDYETNTRFGSLTDWISLTVFLASFAPLINAHADEPKLATYMVMIAIFGLLLMAYLHISAINTSRINPGILFGVMFIILLLLIAYIWILLRLWIIF